jgi:ribonuclease T2
MSRRPILRAALAFVLAAWALDSAAAEVRLRGSFTATKACPAFQSIKKETNPGSIEVAAGKVYDVLAKNAETATHYRIRVDGATPPERWVAIDCGTLQERKADADGGKGRPAEFLLTLSWEPAFCEGHSAKPECKAETDASFEATHFALHGLWPQPRSNVYCKVDQALIDDDKKSDWESLPEVALGADTRTRLDKVMPGTQSKLERHEWIKHGTCYRGLDQETYFKQALSLMDEINGSAVQALFSGNVGKEVKAADIRAAFDSAFGAGTGDRVKVSCGKDGSRQLVEEITIGLAGPDGKLADMTKAAKGTDAGCTSGIVDQTGTQ